MRRSSAALVASLFATACASPDPASPRADVVTSETSTRDAPLPTDARSDASADAAIDAPPYDPCAIGAIRDLNALGTLTGETTRVTSDNLSAGRMRAVAAPCALNMVGYQVAWRYTPRRTTSLRISTNDTATDARLDTVVLALDACPAAGANATVLGCGDDTGDAPRDHATTFVTDAAVRAGAPVYILVGGFLHATAELWDSQGRYALAVSEQ
jgi:hypothetical protein